MSKLDLNTELAALDHKERKFYQSLDDQERKKFSTYLMLRYSASVSGHPDLQAYYLMATNENVNKHFFDLSKHPELQWLSCTTVSPGMGTQRHYWHNTKKDSKNTDAYQKKLTKMVREKKPNLSDEEIDLWILINGIPAIEQWILDHGDELPKA